MSTSVFASEQLLKWLFTGSSVGTRPTEWYVSLHTGHPGVDGAANEVTDTNYVRQEVTFTAAAAGELWEVTNDADILFPASAAAYTVSYVCVFDAETGGNALAILELPLARSISANGVFSIPINELIIAGAGEE